MNPLNKKEKYLIIGLLLLLIGVGLYAYAESADDYKYRTMPLSEYYSDGMGDIYIWIAGIFIALFGGVFLFSAMMEHFLKKEKTTQKIPTRMCPNCGCPIPMDARICPYCAKKFW